MTAMIVDLKNNTHLNGVFGRLTGQAKMRNEQAPIRWCFMLDNPKLFDGRHADGVEVKTANLRMMTIDRRRTQKAGTMWLYSMGEAIEPPEFFTKILQHYQLYQPAFLGNTEFSSIRPFIQAMVDIMIPWEKEASKRNSLAALMRQEHTLAVTPVAVPEDTDILSEDPSDEDDWSDPPGDQKTNMQQCW